MAGLILDRKPGTAVYLDLPSGGRITVRYVERRSSNRARLLFDAPADVKITRDDAKPQAATERKAS